MISTGEFTDQLTWSSYTPVRRGIDAPSRVTLNAHGWLTAVLVRPSDRHPDLHFEVTDVDGALYADFDVASNAPSGGVWFEPIPNVNTACPYYLEIPEGSPSLLVISVDRRSAQ